MTDDDLIFLENYGKEIKELTYLMKLDRKTVIRKAFESGMRELIIRASLEKYVEGSISLGRAAEMAGLSYIDMFDEMHKRGINIRYGKERMARELKDI